MMSWSPTSNREATSALCNLWRMPAWRESTHATEIESVLRQKLVDQDDVNRLHAAQVAIFLAGDGNRFDFVVDLLGAEQRLEVAAVLLGHLRSFADERSADVDAVIEMLRGIAPWVALLRESERDPDLIDALGVMTGLVLYMTIRHQTPAASALAGEWMRSPVATDAARRAVVQLRGWIALPDERAGERRRAFDLLDLAITRLVQLRQSAAGDENLKAIFTVADSIAHEIYFASGAHASGNDAPTPAASGFVEDALVILEKLAEFKHPAITYAIVETVDHIAPANPIRAFHVVGEAVKNGDEYTYDGLAAEKTVLLVERYFTEFGDFVLADDLLLTVIRSVLSAFVSVGWPAAIALAYRLSDTFR